MTSQTQRHRYGPAALRPVASGELLAEGADGALLQDAEVHREGEHRGDRVEHVAPGREGPTRPLHRHRPPLTQEGGRDIVELPFTQNRENRPFGLEKFGTLYSSRFREVGRVLFHVALRKLR